MFVCVCVCMCVYVHASVCVRACAVACRSPTHALANTTPPQTLLSLTRGDMLRLHRFAAVSTMVVALVAACTVLGAECSNLALVSPLRRLWRWWIVGQAGGDLSLLLQWHRVRLARPISAGAILFRFANLVALTVSAFLLVSGHALDCVVTPSIAVVL